LSGSSHQGEGISLMPEKKKKKKKKGAGRSWLGQGMANKARSPPFVSSGKKEATSHSALPRKRIEFVKTGIDATRKKWESLIVITVRGGY